MFTILTIFKCTVQWYWANSQCCAAITTVHFQNFPNKIPNKTLPYSTVILYPASPYLFISNNIQSTFWFCEFTHSRYLIWMESYNICLVTRLILFNKVFLRFIHVVVYIIISFPFKSDSITLYVYTTFCLPIHLLLHI